jgi:2-oxoglutarate ferredoxin oxidoreductase subunit beta
MQDPQKIQLLHHESAMQISSGIAKVYKNHLEHNPLNLDRAREIASSTDKIPVGILYQNPEIPCYEDLRRSDKLRTADYVRKGLESEFDKFTVWPETADAKRAA